jgi:hypothetical protein
MLNNHNCNHEDDDDGLYGGKYSNNDNYSVHTKNIS